MKIIVTVLLALIPGIFSYSNADGFKEEIRSWCYKNGGPKAYENVKNVGDNTIDIIESAAEEIVRAFRNSSDGIDAAITVYCGKVGILHENIDSFLEALSPCLEPGDRELGSLSNFTASNLQFPCANKDLVKDVFNSTNLQLCIPSKLDSLAECLQDILEDRNTTLANVTSSGIDSDETIQPELKSKNQTCSDVLSFQQCTVKVLAECEDQIFSTTVDTLYKYVNNDIPCENLPKSPK